MKNLPLNKILPGDCTEILPRLPGNSVDLIFADPPYNLQLSQDLFRPNATRVSAVDDTWDQFQDFDAYDEFTRSWLSGCRHVLKETGTLWVIGTYHNIFRIGRLLQDMDFWILNDIIWIKKNPMPNFRGVRFTNAHETLIWAQKEKGAKYHFNHRTMKALNDDLQMRSDWVLPLCTGNERCKTNGKKAHTTQKPESLLYRLIMASSNPDDVILDPFFGTGTTGAVAKKIGRHYIGIERDLDYIKIAENRIRSVQTAPAEALSISERRNGLRIPFGRLVETGFLRPGQILTMAENESVSATVLSNGYLQSGAIIGSIHQVAKACLRGMPVNGWDCWLYDDKGQKKPIDILRQKYTLLIGDHV